MNFKTNIEAIQHVFDDVSGKHLLDVGCGRGRLSRALIKRGARMTGIDPSEEMIALARENAPDAKFDVSGAQSLPFGDDTFDGAVILNSLHHVPEPLVDGALSEAVRVSRGPF